MQNYKKAIALCVLLLALAGCWYFLTGRNDVYDIGERADAVRAELTDIGEEQREQSAAIDKAAEAVRDSQQTARRIEEIERSDAEVIRESQSIIRRVRERGPAQNRSES